MKTRNMMVLTGALLLAGGTTMFGMGGDSVEGTETKTECRGQGGKGCGMGGRWSCGNNKGCEKGGRQYRNRQGQRDGAGHHGRGGNNAGRGGFRHGGQQYGKGNMHRGQMMGKMLNLTAEQQTKFKALREKNSKKIRQIHQDLRNAQKALREAAQSETIDKAQIAKLSKILADKMATAAIARATAMKEVKALLTDEQRAKLAAKKAEFKQRMAAKRGKCTKQGAKNVKQATE
jgi:Spy/CpxP family protein refolding chaperone